MKTTLTGGNGCRGAAPGTVTFPRLRDSAMTFALRFDGSRP